MSVAISNVLHPLRLFHFLATIFSFFLSIYRLYIQLRGRDRSRVDYQDY